MIVPNTFDIAVVIFLRCNFLRHRNSIKIFRNSIFYSENWNSEVFIFFLRSPVGNEWQYLFHCHDFCFFCTKNLELPDQGGLDLCKRQMIWNNIACQIGRGKSYPRLIHPFEHHMLRSTKQNVILGSFRGHFEVNFEVE